MNKMIRSAVLALTVSIGSLSVPAYEVDFDNAPLGAALFWNGSDESGGITNQEVFFRNSYFASWSGWFGFAFSRVNDTNTPGYQNPYACYGGVDVSGTGVYAVVYDDSTNEADIVTFPFPSLVLGFFVNNTTYAALAMRDGYFVAHLFGGLDGNNPDWFLLTVTGRDEEGNELGSVAHYLADFRFTNNALDYIQSDWQWLDLTPLGPNVKTLHFTLRSSDTNRASEMNTPAYFAMDNLRACYAEPPPSSNSTAFYRTANAFVAWAAGWTNYLVGGSVLDHFMTPANALGPPSEDISDIVCLGDGGSITMTFDLPIADGPGWDFAVFENACVDTFLELAWVEVSSDGVHFFRFPNHSLTLEPAEEYGEVYATNIAGLAGKYELGYGTPFDLRALPADSRLDKTDIRWVRLIDLVGDGYCVDSFGHPIYDPHPTRGSAGFDLAAVGVIHFRGHCRIAASNPAGPTIQWEAITNRLYQLQCVDNLMSSNWVNLGAAIPGANQAVSVSDTNFYGERRYYRVVRTPMPGEEGAP